MPSSSIIAQSSHSDARVGGSSPPSLRRQVIVFTHYFA
jgi:hypothetical protein